EVRDEHEEAERQRRARFEQATGGEPVDQGHDQAERDEASDPAHGARISMREGLLTTRRRAGNLATMAFAHLHTHSEFSLLDGANRIPDLLARVQALGMDSLAISDNGNLHCAWAFTEEPKPRTFRPSRASEPSR